MKKLSYAAAAVAALIMLNGAQAQSSGQGTPNTLHGSGDMMQDGPHASSDPNMGAEGDALPSGKAPGTYQSRQNACEKRWVEARNNGTASTTTHDRFIKSCLKTR
jgi:hypothetical protein